MKVLILKPSSLGDVIQALPVLRLLKLKWPDSEVHWWIASGLASLFEGDPHVHRLIPFQRSRWQSPLLWMEMVQSIREMRQQRYDLVIDLQGLARSGTFAWLANAGMSIGLGDHREGARGYYDITVDRPSRNAHAVDWYLRVAERLGLPVAEPYEWIPRRELAAQSIASKWSPQGKRWLAVCPGARWLNKRWPVEHFKELLQLMAVRSNTLHFAILGGPEDNPLGESISEAIPGRCLDLTGKTSLPELIEWVRVCDAMVTNDTGPMHIAAALGVPVAAVFGPTKPAHTGPYRQTHLALRNTSLSCVPCMKSHCKHEPELECLTSLRPATIARQLDPFSARWSCD